MRAVTFDCWGTLIADRGYEQARAARIEAIVAAGEGRIDTPAADELLTRAVRTHFAAWMRAEQYGSSGVASYCGEELGLDAMATAELQAAIEDASRHGSVVALHGAVETLVALRAAGIRTALVCDAGMTPGRVVRGFLEELGLLEHLEHCTFSDEVGVPKPNAAIFRDALDAIEVDGGAGIHVGDLLRTDVHGGRQMGMCTVRITAENDDIAGGYSWEPTDDGLPFADADEVVKSHRELVPALRRLGAPLD